MDAFLSVLSNVLIFVALALPGWILVKTKTLKEEQSVPLSKLLMWVGMPFLILSSTMRLKFSGTLIAGMGITFGITAAYILLWFFLTAIFIKKEQDEKKRSMMRFCILFSNNGFLGLPLAAAVFGDTSDAYFYLVIANVLTNLFMYTLGVYLISGDKDKMSFKKALINPVLIAFVVGIVFNLVNVNKYIPHVLTFSDHFKGIVTPISMTILGMKMGGVKFTSLFRSRKMYVASAFKLLALPVGAVVIAYFLGMWVGIGTALASAMFVSFGTPTAGLASTFADAYEGDTEGAAEYTLGTTVLSIATIPVLYWVLSLVI